MTPIRAKEIIRTAHEAATPGPWVDQIDRLIDATEREEINSIWERMPGYSTFVDALQRIADDRTDELNYEWELRFNYGYSLTLMGSYSKCANQHSNYRFDKRYVLVKTDRRFKNIDDTIDYEHNRQVSSQHAEMVNGNGTLYCCRCGTIGENDTPEIRKWHGDRLPQENQMNNSNRFDRYLYIQFFAGMTPNGSGRRAIVVIDCTSGDIVEAIEGSDTVTIKKRHNGIVDGPTFQTTPHEFRETLRQHPRLPQLSMNEMYLKDAGERERSFAKHLLSTKRMLNLNSSYTKMLTHGIYNASTDTLSMIVKGKLHVWKVTTS